MPAPPLCMHEFNSHVFDMDDRTDAVLLSTSIEELAGSACVRAGYASTESP